MLPVTAMIIADRENAGYYRALCGNGERIEHCIFDESFECLERYKPAVLVIDSGYRVWTGLSVMRRIRETHPSLPVIFLTDFSSEDAAVNAFKLGAQAYFKKPVNLFELREAMERTMDTKKTAPGAGRHEENTRVAGEGLFCAKYITTDKPENILQVVAFIRENLWTPLELDQLAAKAHLSKFHFCRVFKRHVGMNPMKFVAALRIERAKELLKQNNLTVSLVANEVGFRDLSNFIRQFKKVTGVTPTMYRGAARMDGIADANVVLSNQ